MQIKLRDGDEIWNDAERMFRQYQVHYGDDEEEDGGYRDRKRDKEEDLYFDVSIIYVLAHTKYVC